MLMLNWGIAGRSQPNSGNGFRPIFTARKGINYNSIKESKGIPQILYIFNQQQMNIIDMCLEFDHIRFFLIWINRMGQI